LPFRNPIFAFSKVLACGDVLMVYLQSGKKLAQGRSRLGQRKFDLIRRFHLPEDSLPVSLFVAAPLWQSYLPLCPRPWSCGVVAHLYGARPEAGPAHPQGLGDDVRCRVQAKGEFQDAVREVLAANALCLAKTVI
jgi:hypothetical protein